MTTDELKYALLSYLKELGVTHPKIHKGTAKNPIRHILGNRNLGQVCRGNKISEEKTALLILFFQNQNLTQ